MADLDDFFAKKDKKKAKSKPKFLTADELVKNLERETAAAKPKKSDIVSTVPSVALGVADDGKSKVLEQNTEEEWDEFEEEQRKDYTGLKIGQLTLDDEDEHSFTERNDEDGDREDHTNVESITSKSSGGGPWKKVIPADEVTQIPMEIEAPSRVYISPALRQNQAICGSGSGGSSFGMMAGSRTKARNRAAPDITNSDYFPTLGAARPEEQRKKKNEPAFEEVKHGGRVHRIQEVPAASVTMANRFQSLEEDES